MRQKVKKRVEFDIYIIFRGYQSNYIWYIKASMQVNVTEQKDQKSNNPKNNNPKIGRPAKTDQEEQFKNQYLQNRKKFQLECELLVYIHQIFFEQIPTHPTNQRVNVEQMVRLFHNFNCLNIYKSLVKLNECYYKSSSHFPEQKFKYTSLIDVSYLMHHIKVQHGDKINSYELILIIFFFLFNEKVVNAPFYEYFKKRIEIFRNGMINGPDNCELNKMDTLIIALALQVAIRQGMMIQEEVEEDSSEDNNQQFSPALSKPKHSSQFGRAFSEQNQGQDFQYVELDEQFRELNEGQGQGSESMSVEGDM